MNAMPTCGSCPWSDLDPMSRKGFCRINPPVVLQGHTSIIAAWPHIKDMDWCGAHPAFNTVDTVLEVKDGEDARS